MDNMQINENILLQTDSLMHRAKMFDALMSTTGLLLSADENDDFEHAVLKSMELIGSSLNADRVHIWQRNNIGNEFLLINIYMWISDLAKDKAVIPQGIMTPYKNMSEWEAAFENNKYIGGPITSLSEDEYSYFAPFDLKSVLLIPIHMEKQLWGLISVDDCEYERFFSDDEINLLQSISLMIASLVNKRAFSQLLNDANERMTLMLDSSPLCTQIWGNDLSTIDCNEAGVKLYGFKNKQEYKERFITSCSPEFQPDGQRSDVKAVALVRKAFEEGYCAFDWMHKMPDDEIMIPAEITLVRAKYKNDDVVIGYTRDLREHYKMIEDIKQRDNMLGVIRESERKAITASEYTSMLSNALSEITKSPNIPAGDIKAAAEIIAKEGCNVLKVHRISIWSLSNDENALQNITCYERSTGEHSVNENFDLTNRPKYSDLLNTERLIVASDIHESAVLDDGYNPNLCAMLEAPIRIDGKLAGMVCADLDRCYEFPEKREWMSEEMNFVSSLADLMALAISGYERRKAREDAEKANKAKSSFLANTSHEIRTPMNAILGITEIMMQKKSWSEEDKEDLERIHNSGVMLLGIINDILDLSKIEADKFEIMASKYAVASLINDTTQLNMIRIGSKHIDFIVEIDNQLPRELIGDELRIKQVLNNLLSNAFKYTESGTVALSITTETSPDEGNIFLVFSVRDTGCGMSEEQLDALFDEYSRFNQDHGDNIEGIGLGLAITHRLVHLMNGDIGVTSKPGIGSVFTVWLPQQKVDDILLSGDVIKNLQEFSYKSDIRYERRTEIRDKMPYGNVLVVDDFESNLRVAKGILKMFDLKIDTVESGYKAVDKVKSNNVYDIIFMDHMMPGIDGIETVKQIRDHGYDHPIIALTANAIVGQAEVFLNNGFDGFLSKPIDIRNLTCILNRFIRDKQPHEVLKAAKLNMDFPGERSDDLSNEALTENNDVLNKLRAGKIEGLNIPAGLERYHNDPNEYIAILRSFVSSVRSVLGTVETVDENNLYDYKIVVHGIKGAGFDIFAEHVGTIYKDLEQAADDNNIEFIKQKNPEAVESARKIISDIEEFLHDITGDTEKPDRDRIDSKVLLKLMEACSVYDMDNVDATMTEIETYSYTYDKKLVEELREYVDLMNYVKITEIISGLERNLIV